MDVDAYVMANQPTWDRLDALVKERKNLNGAEIDEMVDLYQRTATHLSVLRTTSPDPHVVGRLTVLVARARGESGQARDVAYRSIANYFLRTFPAAAWRVRWWWAGVAAVTLSLSFVEAVWIATNPDVQAHLLTRAQVQDLDTNFVTYYTENRHGSFAAKVFTNNALIAAGSLVSGLTLVGPIIFMYVTVTGQLGVAGGYLFAMGEGGKFFEYILPHGLLELSAVFMAMGAGLSLGWTVFQPGDGRTRTDALSDAGRRTIALAGGTTVMLFISGILEGFITPSGFPPALRLTIGAVVWAVVVGGTLVLGRRASMAGITGDLVDGLEGARDRRV